MKNAIDQTREALIEEIVALDLVAPEQVTDIVMITYDRHGMQAAREQLLKCIEANDREAKRLLND